jgi:enoyl-CoA hydratase/carnithine racemase
MRYEKRDHLAIITIDRPERGNALTPTMHSIFRAIWADVRDDAQVRCVILTAAGDRHFCTGADVSAGEAADVLTGAGRVTHEIFWSARENDVWKPVICAVNGLAAAAGLHFVVEADIVVASENAAFMDTHVNVGMVGAVENIGLAKRLPLGTALRMTLQGKAYRLPARRAYEIGLVDELVSSADLLGTAESIAADIVKNSPHAVSLSQQAIWGSLEMPYAQAVEYGWALARLHWQHPDFKEGLAAFAERRDPVWTVSLDATYS